MDNFLLGLASFVLVLVPLVVIHELGHFIGAKLVGITVLEFGIGFPPRAKKLFTRGDTIYTLNWLPIGGFVRPYGEDFVRQKNPDELSADRREIEERGVKNPKSVFQASPWERMLFLIGGPGINFVAALALFIFVALVGQPFARADVTVYDVLPASPAAEAGLHPGDVITAVNDQQVESADEFNRLIVHNAGQTITLQVVRDAETFSAELTIAADTSQAIERVYIDTVERNMPAYEAGFLPEDLIVAVDGIEITSIEQLQQYTQAHESEEIVITVLRGGERLELPVKPRADENGVVRIGIGIAGVEPAVIGLTAVNRNTHTYTRALPLGEAISTGVNQFVDLHRMMAGFVGDLIRGDIAPEAARPVSPVGISQIGAPIFEQSLDEGEMYPIVLFAALISVALAITNLLPIPGLDGGRILFVVIELIRGKPMQPEREGLIHLIGVMLLLGVIFLTVLNDIFNPINIDNLR
jgi:regulator of sigma E protease